MQKPAPHRHVDGQRLSASVEHEFVSEVLQVVRFGGAFICREEIEAPWGFEMGGRNFGNFYIFLSGEACLEVGFGCLRAISWFCLTEISTRCGTHLAQRSCFFKMRRRPPRVIAEGRFVRAAM